MSDTARSNEDEKATAIIGLCGAACSSMSALHIYFFFSSRRRHTRCSRDWSSDVCSSDLQLRTTSRDLFFETSGEFFGVWEALKPVVPTFRERFVNKQILAHLEEAAKRYEIGRASCRERV